MTKLLNIKELSERLSISHLTIYNWVSQRKIPFYKISNLIRFREDEVESWLSHKKITPYKYK